MSTPGLPERRLSMLDCTSIIVGIIIGSGIYESIGLVAGLAAGGRELAGSLDRRRPVRLARFALLRRIGDAPARRRGRLRLPHAGVRPRRRVSCSPGRSSGSFGPARSARWPASSPTYATQLYSLGPHSLPDLRVRFGRRAHRCSTWLGVRQSTHVQNVLTGAKVLGLAVLIVGRTFRQPAPISRLGRMPIRDRKAS